ncbi:hypothetical protein [Paenibacillus gansuensis]|uniref:Uncharacterized protein n=1 Tax=Paenibacillus gansuensis TaxID=306542 RepID=A0ABW5P9L9_9BACL
MAKDNVQHKGLESELGSSQSSDPYNPFQDATIHQSVQTDPVSRQLDVREGFNDALKHVDTVNGHRLPKQLTDFPSRWRKVLRWAIIAYILMFAAFLLYSTFIDR